MNEVKHVCDLCSLGIPESELCYVGIHECKKNGVYMFFKNREAEEKERELDKACEMLADSNFDCPLERFGCKLERCEYNCDNDKNGECWKEYLLNES